MRFQTLPGFRDFFPEEMALRRAIEDAWHRASRAAGYLEFDGPVLEALELYTAKSGEEVVGQLYAFEDQGGRKVAMRPEMTPTLARMIAAHAGGMPKPIKWYCTPQFFRYERPQKGRGREFIQWNVDIVGAADPVADAEAIQVALEGLRILGLGAEDLVVRLSDRRLLARMLDRLEIPEEQRGEVLGTVDKLERDRKAKDRLAELLGAARAEELLGWCSEFPLTDATELQPVLEACEDFGISDYVSCDFKVVRGLAYYTGPVWEIFARNHRLRAVAGGGRYDGLVKALGGPDLPALGFGMGDMVLAELLRATGKEPPAPPRAEVFVVPIGDDMLRPARRVLTQLRRAGVSSDGPYAAARVGKALKLATRAGASRAVLVGADEWAEGKVKVKELESGEERVVALEDLQA